MAARVVPLVQMQQQKLKQASQAMSPRMTGSEHIKLIDPTSSVPPPKASAVNLRSSDNSTSYKNFKPGKKKKSIVFKEPNNVSS